MNEKYRLVWDVSTGTTREEVIPDRETRMSSSPVKPEDDEKIPISCGNLTAYLLMSRFICPGIHQECILFDGEIVTPKMFSVMGEKEKLKDWKNAIRVNGKSIRKVMDRGLLDFSNHQNHCTGRCVSRNTGCSKYDLLDGDPAALNMVAEMSSLGKEQAYTVLREMTGEEAPEAASFGIITKTIIPETPAPRTSASWQKQKVIRTSNIPAGIQLVQAGSTVFPLTGPVPAIPLDSASNQPIIDIGPSGVIIKQEPAVKVGTKKGSEMSEQEELNKLLSGNVTYHPIGSSVEEEMGEAWLEDGATEEDDLKDSQAFWRGLMEVGILDEIFVDIKSSLEGLKRDLVTHRVRNKDARRLTKIVHRLNLMKKIKQKMAKQKSKTILEKQKLLEEIEALKNKVRLQEKMQKELKRKSECFDQLMELSRAKRSNPGTPNSVQSPEPSNTNSQDSTASVSDTSDDDEEES